VPREAQQGFSEQEAVPQIFSAFGINYILMAAGSVMGKMIDDFSEDSIFATLPV
jgi:hypothetical protein